MHVLLLVVVASLAAGPAVGAVFTDRGAWEAALTSRQDISFNAMTPSTYVNINTGTAPDTVFFAPINQPWFYIMADTWWDSCDVRCLYTEAGGNSKGIVAVMAQATNTAVGFNLFSVSATPQTLTVRIFNVGSSTADYTTSVTTVAYSAPTPVFFGYTGTSAIEHVEIVGPTSSGVVIDNFSYGVAGVAPPPPPPPPPPSETPEVPTLSYFGIGLLAVLIGSKRRITQ
ncbi:MAG: hypothetical protein JNK48_33120 [Bryobacterales bacterium]|nr:hypothetical protein [Bryobacterales bacterium]